MAGGVVTLAAAMVSGCLQNPNASGGGAGGGGGNAVARGGSPANDKIVTILGAFGGAEEKNFNASLAAFEKQTGIKIQYTSDQDFTTTIKQKVSSGDSPDIGLFPQPGGLLEFAAQGKIQPIDTFLNYDQLDRTLIKGFLDASRYKGRVYGAPMRMAFKSLIWYPKEAYTKAGYTTQPKTFQELQTQVIDKIKATGTSPWCEAWGSDQATGWVGTDWVEQMMLELYGPDVYDDWVAHRIPFNDPRVVKAMDEVGKIIKDDNNSFGGPKGVLNTAFGDAMNPAFQNPPKCLLMRQGNFITTFLPAKVQSNLDNQVGTMVFPPWQGGYQGQPVLGGGDIAGLFNGGDPDAQKVMQFLTSDKFGAEWAKAGGWLSPHKTFDSSNYPDATTKLIAKLAADASVFRYDGSDSMPKEVGSGTFWTEMVKWMNGQSTQATADAIESSWPKS
ncbi:ABC transporter substrate-binding protein [Intrasporangium oryzae]|nr:ABC transporter substrate-binding protein [Intrasporangium oryzae]